jgi:hypothetical protein
LSSSARQLRFAVATSALLTSALLTSALLTPPLLAPALSISAPASAAGISSPSTTASANVTPGGRAPTAIPSTSKAGEVKPAPTLATSILANREDQFKRSSIVGFWAGETRVVNGKDVDAASNYWAPRDLSMYTPALWRTLSTERITLYHRQARGIGSDVLDVSGLEGARTQSPKDVALWAPDDRVQRVVGRPALDGKEPPAVGVGVQRLEAVEDGVDLRPGRRP